MRQAVTDNARKAANTWKNAWDETLDGKIAPKIRTVLTPEAAKGEDSPTPATGLSTTSKIIIPTNPSGDGNTDKDAAKQAKEYREKLEKLLEMTQQEQQARFKEYYATLGKKSFEDFLEGFIAAVENKRNETSNLIKQFTLKEEEEKEDPAAEYALQKYAQTQQGQLNMLYQRLKAGKISEQQYQDEVTQIYRQAAEKRAKIQEQEAERSRQLTYLAGSFVQSLMDYELEMAGENEEKKAQIRKKYSALQFGVTAGQIIVDTAASIMKALAELGPIAGPIAAALMAATGSVQLGIAQAQIGKLESDKGYSQGGYTGPGGKHQPAGVVHAGEWVAPMEMVQSPATAPLIAWLEQQRRTGSFTVLRPGQIREAQARGYSQGGMVAEAGSQQGSGGVAEESASGDNLQVQALQRLTLAVEKLMKWQPRVYTEDIRKGLDNLSDIEKRRGM